MDHLSDPTNEACVALVGTRTDDRFVVVDMIPVPNMADDPTEDFAIYGSALADIIAVGLPVIGVVHSHLARHGPEPSSNDLAEIRPGWLGGVFYVAADGTWTITWYGNAKVPATNTP